MYSVGEVRNRLFNSTGRKLRLFVVDPDRSQAGADDALAATSARQPVARKQARAKPLTATAAASVAAAPRGPGADPAARALSALVSDPVPASAIAAAEKLGLSEEKLAIIGGVALVKVRGFKAGEPDELAWAALVKKAEQWLAMLGHG
jgi:hypothetical protein